MANLKFSGSFCVEAQLSAVLHILIHPTLTSLLPTLNLASALGGGVRGRLPGGSGGFCLQQRRSDSNAELENLRQPRLNAPLPL